MPGKTHKKEPINYTKITKDDFDRIRLLSSQCLRERNQNCYKKEYLDFLTKCFKMDCMKSYYEEPWTYLVFTKGGKDVGFMKLTRDGKNCLLNTVYLLKQYHKSNVGKFMLETARNWARKNECEQVLIKMDNNELNQITSKRMLFEPVGSNCQQILDINDYIILFKLN